MTLSIYTDASYSYQKRIAACAFILKFRSSIIGHNVFLVDKVLSCNHAEIYAAYLGLHNAINVKEVTRIQVLTDSRLLHDIINELDKTFVERNPNQCTELLEVLDIFKSVNIEVSSIKVKGHSNNDMNKKVDISARKQLRSHLKGYQH